MAEIHEQGGKILVEDGKLRMCCCDGVNPSGNNKIFECFPVLCEPYWRNMFGYSIARNGNQNNIRFYVYISELELANLQSNHDFPNRPFIWCDARDDGGGGRPSGQFWVLNSSGVNDINNHPDILVASDDSLNPNPRVYGLNPPGDTEPSPGVFLRVGLSTVNVNHDNFNGASFSQPNGFRCTNTAYFDGMMSSTLVPADLSPDFTLTLTHTYGPSGSTSAIFVSDSGTLNTRPPTFGSLPFEFGCSGQGTPPTSGTVSKTQHMISGLYNMTVANINSCEFSAPGALYVDPGSCSGDIDSNTGLPYTYWTRWIFHTHPNAFLMQFCATAEVGSQTTASDYGLVSANAAWEPLETCDGTNFPNDCYTVQIGGGLPSPILNGGDENPCQEAYRPVIEDCSVKTAGIRFKNAGGFLMRSGGDGAAMFFALREPNINICLNDGTGSTQSKVPCRGIPGPEPSQAFCIVAQDEDGNQVEACSKVIPNNTSLLLGQIEQNSPLFSDTIVSPCNGCDGFGPWFVGDAGACDCTNSGGQISTGCSNPGANFNWPFTWGMRTNIRLSPNGEAFDIPNTDPELGQIFLCGQTAYETDNYLTPIKYDFCRWMRGELTLDVFASFANQGPVRCTDPRRNQSSNGCTAGRPGSTLIHAGFLDQFTSQSVKNRQDGVTFQYGFNKFHGSTIKPALSKELFGCRYGYCEDEDPGNPNNAPGCDNIPYGGFAGSGFYALEQLESVGEKCSGTLIGTCPEAGFDFTCKESLRAPSDMLFGFRNIVMGRCFSPKCSQPPLNP